VGMIITGFMMLVPLYGPSLAGGETSLVEVVQSGGGSSRSSYGFPRTSVALDLSERVRFTPARLSAASFGPSEVGGVSGAAGSGGASSSIAANVCR
jgi:hypothetical protein